MNNYLGIGLDAKITLDFQNKREEHPEKCRYNVCQKNNKHKKIKLVTKYKCTPSCLPLSPKY
ncbi:hypothetical protein DPMN_133138 [Dreissena polymorpha]|uniref:Diacylglycerol kinase accessory domain-containing protein n=1 Tax=Dreissena polymorpha TaxID=45954 RepID=A0A9D4J9H7_DREPO|nr:hypothetical protein DPMN_133138 [Dreissena polymorpha]